MKSRPQDELDQLPSLSLSADDRSERKPDRGKTAAKSSAAKASEARASETRASSGSAMPDRKTPPNKTTHASGASVHSSGISIATVVLGVALIAMGGFGYWQISALQQELTSARSELNNTASQLSAVSGVVSETGATLSKSDSAVRDELNAVNFEIRKLWDLSNKRNRASIVEQDQRLSKLDKDLATSRKEMKSSLGLMTKNTTALEAATKSLSALQREVRALSTSASVNSEQLSGLESSMGKLSGSLKQALVSHQKLTGQVDVQLKDFSGQMKAVNAHRQQVNKRLLQLENSIRSLESGSQPGLTIQPAG